MIDRSGSRSRLGIIVLGSLTAIISILIFNSLVLFVKADNINPGIYSKDSNPSGVSYGGWIAKWWLWTMGIPSGEHPRDHFSQQTCSVHQSGPVWFLADLLSGKQERTCTIPAGKAILVPMLTGNCDADGTTPGAPASESDPALIQCAIAGDQYGVISASLDGRQLQNLQQYRTATGFFNLVVPNDNAYSNKPGTWRAYSEGFFVFLEPLPPGNHDLHLTTSVFNPYNVSYNYSADLTYHLIIQP
ncbi:MAG TPA: hypothetical protein VI278_06350 [Nitrososphaeraceae archaeon]